MEYNMKEYRKITGFIKLLEFLPLLLLFTSSVYALNITVNIDVKPNFTEGETIAFHYNITSDERVTVEFIPSVYCPDAPMPLLEIKRIELKKNEVYNDTYTFIKVDGLEPQTCSALISILSPYNYTAEKKFEIITKPSFEFEVFSSKDKERTKKSKIFIKGETIYLSYSSEVPNPKITGVLVFPDKTEKTVTLPTSLKAEQIGTYTLRVTAEKEGYKPVKKMLQFAVIEKHAEIKYEFICNKNGRCDVEAGENYGNCPEDCPSGSKDNYCDKVKDGRCDPDCEENEDIDCGKFNYNLVLLLFFIGVTALIGLTLFLRKTRKYERHYL